MVAGVCDSGGNKSEVRIIAERPPVKIARFESTVHNEIGVCQRSRDWQQTQQNNDQKVMPPHTSSKKRTVSEWRVALRLGYTIFITQEETAMK
jgi:hypothetical protein